MIEESILRSVGENGANVKRDVVTVQRLINGATAHLGKPFQRLELDGICGPKTLKAIRDFQTRFVKELKFVDGRVDPNQVTLNKLNRLAGYLPRLNTGQAYLDPKHGQPKHNPIPRIT
jgi:hypothetical protein